MPRLIHFFAFIALTFSCSDLFAQQYSIAGLIKDKSGAPIPAAAVSLLKASDSSWLKSELGADDGAFVVRDILPGNYVLTFTAIGFENIRQSIAIASANVTGLSMVMQKSNTTLNEVTVSSKKPFIELSMGKVVVNVENSIASAGTNVLELLKKSPGIQVDNLGNVSMHGKSGVLILIDDRPTYLSGQELADYLKGLSSEDIAQLELITQPSAKYDAEANGGIINIKTKKSHKDGLSGTASATYGQSVYGYNTGNIQLNYYKNKLRLFTADNYTVGTGFANWTETDHFTDLANRNLLSSTIWHSQPKEYFSNFNLRIGVDYEYTNKTTVGISIGGNYHPNTMHTNTFSTYEDNLGNVSSYNDRYVFQRTLKRNITSNVFLKHSFSKESELNLNFDYVVYDARGGQNINSTDYNTPMQAQPDPLIQRSSVPVGTEVYSFKADYSKTVLNKVKIETGFKSSFVTRDNKSEFTDLVNNSWIPDTGLSNEFFYQENINAAYVNANKFIGDKWELQAGLRAENANVYGHQFENDEHFERNDIALFPTAFVAYKLNDQNRFELNYGRRVERPSYVDLNPFKWYTFYNNYKVGNPDLLAEYTHNIELKHIYKNALVTTLSFSDTKNGINYVTFSKDTSQTLYWSPENIANKESVSLSITFNKLLLKWWNLAFSSDVYYTDYHGEEGGETASSSGFGSYFSLDSQFTLSKQWSVEMNAYYSGSSTQLTYTQYPMGTMGVGVAKKVLKDAGTVKLNLYDVFHTDGSHSADVHSNFNSTASLYDNSRGMVGFSFSYKFGSKKDNTQRKDNSLPEETKRIQM